MALRLRRGTDAERLTITPVEGELIYTTDLQELWIGDGVTTGGNKIGGIIPQFLDDLSNVDAASPEIGQVLKWDGNNWVASDDEDTGVVEGASYKINILGPDSVTIVDSDTATFAGNFVGDGSGLTNLPIATDGSGIVEGSNYRINIVDDSSTIMLDTATATFTGNFVGDGSGLTNLPGVTSLSIFDLDDVFRFENQTPDAGDTLIYDGFNFVSQKIRQIEGADSTIIVDANSNTFTGTFNGSFAGDGSQLTNLPGLSNTSIFDLSDVFALEGFTPDAGDVLQYDGFNFVSQKIQRIEGADSSIMLDTATNTFTGVFVGNITGNVFNDDSSLAYDAVNNILLSNVQNELTTTDLLQANLVRIEGDSVVAGSKPGIQINTDGTVFQGAEVFTILSSHEVDGDAISPIIYRSRGTIDSPTSVQQGDIIAYDAFSGFTDAGPSITTFWEYTIDGTVSPGITPGSVKLNSQNATGGYNIIELLNSAGNTTLIKVTAESFTGDFKGSVFADDSTVLVDAVSGTIPGYISIAELKSITAASVDFADFKSRISLL